MFSRRATFKEKRAVLSSLPRPVTSKITPLNCLTPFTLEQGLTPERDRRRATISIGIVGSTKDEIPGPVDFFLVPTPPNRRPALKSTSHQTSMRKFVVAPVVRNMWRQTARHLCPPRHCLGFRQREVFRPYYGHATGCISLPASNCKTKLVYGVLARGDFKSNPSMTPVFQ